MNKTTKEVMRVKVFKLVLGCRKRTKLQPNQKLHWTKLEKPMSEMTKDERRAAAEKIAIDSLGSLLSKIKGR